MTLHHSLLTVPQGSGGKGESPSSHSLRRAAGSQAGAGGSRKGGGPIDHVVSPGRCHRSGLHGAPEGRSGCATPSDESDVLLSWVGDHSCCRDEITALQQQKRAARPNDVDKMPYFPIRPTNLLHGCRAGSAHGLVDVLMGSWKLDLPWPTRGCLLSARLHSLHLRCPCLPAEGIRRGAGS